MENRAISKKILKLTCEWRIFHSELFGRRSLGGCQRDNIEGCWSRRLVRQVSHSVDKKDYEALTNHETSIFFQVTSFHLLTFYVHNLQDSLGSVTLTISINRNLFIIGALSNLVMIRLGVFITRETHRRNTSSIVVIDTPNEDIPRRVWLFSSSRNRAGNL